MARFDPVPSVWVDGVKVASSLPAAGQVAVLDDVAATWGRSRLADHHSSQRGTFRVLLDPDAARNSYWLRGYELLGKRVTFQWDGPNPVGGANVSWVFFRGRISDVDVQPRPAGDDGRARGAVATVTCTGQLAELSQRLTGTEAWPAETGQQRLQRLVNLASPTVAGIAYRSYWAGAPMAARQVNAQSVLSLLQSLYDTAGGDRLVYLPSDNTINYVRRYAVPAFSATGGRRNRAQLFVPSAGMGLAETGHTVLVNNGANAFWPTLDGRFLEGDGRLSAGMDNRVTRVVFRYTDPVSGSQVSGMAQDATREADGGVASMTLDTELRDATYAGTAATDWGAMLLREGSLLTPTPVVYRGDRAGGFDSVAAAQVFAGAYEVGTDVQGTGPIVFVKSSPWSALGVAPIFAVIGGTVRYAKGWRPTLNLGGVWWDDLTDERPVTCRQLVAGANLTQTTIGQLDKALTFADLRHVSPQLNA